MGVLNSLPRERLADSMALESQRSGPGILRERDSVDKFGHRPETPGLQVCHNHERFPLFLYPALSNADKITTIVVARLSRAAPRPNRWLA